jgi:hypothetical protein
MTTATDAKKWTWSGWVKRGSFDQSGLIATGNSTTDGSGITFVYGTGATLCFYDYISSTFTTNLVTTQVFRDPSAWYHIIVAVDTTQATSSNRVKMYVNGTQITSFSAATYPALNSTGYMNSGTYATTIGREGGFGNYFDGYMAEVNFIDGQALTPSSFGETDLITGVWKPKRYAGTYGTNGFYLPFTDNSALTTSSNAGLGKDFSGNGNYWTTNNISITSGTTYDSMTDVPTLTSATAANFCTLNPLAGSSSLVLSNGNLTATGNTTGAFNRTGTFAIPSGKWYWECVFTSGSGSDVGYGIFNDPNNATGAPVGIYLYLAASGNKYNGSSNVGYGATYTTNDVIGIAFDSAAGSLTFYKNNVSQGVAFTGITGTYFPVVRSVDTISTQANFGQRPFAYTPPTGYVALNTYNLPTSTIVKGNTVMDATTYTGTGASLSVTNTASFKPDLVWVKSRSNATDNELTDSVRGVTKSLISNSTAAEATDTQGLTAFNSNGFTLGTDANYNGSGRTFVGWQWQAGQGSTSSNTNGTITSTVSVNASAGFSVVTYTGTGTTGPTVGHGLGVAPKMIIIKSRNGADNWNVYHASLSNPASRWLSLNLTNAELGPDGTGCWNNTNPTSSVFTVNWPGSGGYTNQSGITYVAYCFAAISGYSAFGSYTGNGSTDGPFIYTGFRPKFVMAKVITASNWWIMFDSTRNPYNAANFELAANLSDAEYTANTSQYTLFDFLSNGFKLRTGSLEGNSNGQTYIYMAFAENPFRNSLAR